MEVMSKISPQIPVPREDELISLLHELAPGVCKYSFLHKILYMPPDS